MHKKFVALILTVAFLLILAINYNFLYRRIVGLLALGNVNVTVEGKTGGKLFLSFKQILDLGETQTIYTEFINTGSITITGRITINIYVYDNGVLRPFAHYYDIYVPLSPGERRAYRTNFVAPYANIYYIQARVPYDGNVVEVWGAFLVKYPTPTTVTYPAAPSPFPVGVGIPKLSLTYPERVDVLQGGSELISITVKNIGETTLHNLKLYISTVELINFSAYPKQIASLDMNDSTIFLVSIDIPTTTPEGTYPFGFELMSDETSEGGGITINVSSVLLISEEEIRKKILNYEFLISETEREIISASSKGFDVSLANQSLNRAKVSLENAKDYFRLRRFEDTEDELKKVKKNLEDAVFRLANAILYVYKPPAFSPFLILLIILIIIVGVISIYYYKKRKEGRPKILRALTETEG
jgi:hypothetical protein